MTTTAIAIESDTQNQASPIPVVEPEDVLADPILRRIAEDALSSLKYSFLAQAARPNQAVSGKTPKSATDEVFARFLATRTPESRAASRAKSERILAAPPEARRFLLGRHGGTDLAQYEKVGAAAFVNGSEKPTIDGSKIISRFERLAQSELFLPAGSPAVSEHKHPVPIDSAMAMDKAAGARYVPIPYKKVGLFIKQVRCLVETDEVGADEIALGGLAVDPDGKATRLITPFRVSGDFDQGEKVTYPNGRLFAEWTIDRSDGWPHVYGATLVMMEQDDGGFYRFLLDLWNVVKAEVIAAVATAAGGAIGAVLGNAVVPIVGAAVGFVLGVLVPWFISLFDNADDLVGVHTPMLSLAASSNEYYQWAGLLDPPRLFDLRFRGDGGSYLVSCYYKVYK